MSHSPYPASLSFWEIKQYLQDIDLLIVGSGIVGLTTAVFYKKMHPNAKVVVVEKGILPSGASTKNAGFACFGSTSEILADLRNASEVEVFDTVSKRVIGLNALRDLLGDEGIGFNPVGGYELFGSEEEHSFEECIEKLSVLNERIELATGLKQTYRTADESITKFGFKNVHHLILNQHEGSIDTGMMMSSLMMLAQKLGIIILNSLEVERLEPSHSRVYVQFTNGWSVSCGHLHVATNGFAAKLLPDLDVQPARAQVLITKPLPDLKVRGTFHMQEGYYYFRNVGNRLLFGGGRQLDIKGETTSMIETTKLIQNDLEEKLHSTIIPDIKIEIEHRWAGIMGVGNKKTSLVERLSDRITCAVRMGGMGVAIGTSIGKQSAELIG